jgi:4-hydroxybenzoate polyprenyltransferase/phosphoglycolate phosphatase-like HAD superfamily hydrolase
MRNNLTTPNNYSKQRTIVVDLDGTLINSDALVESFFIFFRLHPLRIFEVFYWLLHGKAFLKRRLADEITLEVDLLPYNKDLLAWLGQQRTTGASVVLATASDLRIARKVAEHLGFFDEVFGTDKINLSSKNKRDVLIHRYGEYGYEYVGNSSADFLVWDTANVIHIVNPERGVLKTVSKLGRVGMVFQRNSNYFKVLFKAFRMHQWVKNILIFVPLISSHRIMEAQLAQQGLLAFLAFGICASSVYLLNDLLDLPDDRRHPTKFKRPLASGLLPVLHALIYIPVFLISSFLLAICFLPLQFTVVLVAYYLLTLGYSLWLKRVVMLDVIVLAMLYTLRVLAGATAMALMATFWILAFCIFIFLSLAFVKRYTELRDARHKGKNEKASGRGYYPADFELLASLGGSSGYISVLVLALYINDATSGFLYKSPEWMWAACPLMLFWLSRMWLLAHRGQMHDDPIVFAIRDSVSRWIGLGFVLAFVMATFS